MAAQEIRSVASPVGHSSRPKLQKDLFTSINLAQRTNFLKSLKPFKLTIASSPFPIRTEVLRASIKLFIHSINFEVMPPFSKINLVKYADFFNFSFELNIFCLNFEECMIKNSLKII
jgi:hypothetical protein